MMTTGIKQLSPAAGVVAIFTGAMGGPFDDARSWVISWALHEDGHVSGLVIAPDGKHIVDAESFREFVGYEKVA